MKKDSKVVLRGFFRVHLREPGDGTGKIVGDSGWVQNEVPKPGMKLFLADNLGKSAGSLQVGYVALGTGGAPATNATTLPGEIMASTKKTAVTYSNVASSTAQFVATFASGFNSVTYDLSNIGLFASTAATETIFAGNTYASSNVATNQAVNITYQIRFSTA